MLFYILAIALCGMLVVAALGTSVYALIKKKKRLAFGALSALAVLSLIGIMLGYTYVQKSMDYVASEKFQQETREKARGVGKTWGNTLSGVSEGVAESLDEDAITKLANKTAVITGRVIKATSAGLDTTAVRLSVATDKSVADAGIGVGRAEEGIGGSTKNVGVFADFSRAFSGRLRLTAYDAAGSKMDVAEVACKEAAGNGRMIIFDYQYLTPGLSGYCILEALPE